MTYRILVYGDSMSWGIVPMTRKRFPIESRRPGVMQEHLNSSGLAVYVIEDCLNGRRTVWDDPFKTGRNGLVGLAQRVEVRKSADQRIWTPFQKAIRFRICFAASLGSA